MSTAARDALDDKVNQVFAGKCVRKDLVRAVKVGANVPVFVLEYLLGKHCASSDAAAIELGLTVVRDTLANNSTTPMGPSAPTSAPTACASPMTTCP
jgi:ATP-dependent Lon protease